jgi:shikimate kinase
LQTRGIRWIKVNKLVINNSSPLMKIFIAGVSCVGKTAIGTALAQLLDYSFFDLDHEIEEYFGTSVERIHNKCFSSHHYRSYTAKVLQSIVDKNEKYVIALTPGAMMGAHWRIIKKINCLKIVLQDKPENIFGRIRFYDIDSKQMNVEITPKEKKLYISEIRKDITYYKRTYLKTASVLWLDMQGSGHAAVVNYCKCPVTQQIRPQDALEEFACFEFFTLIFLMRSFHMNIYYNIK